MTLKEAYEIQRKEVHSLRRENEKLRQGTYTDAEKAAHEKEIRHLRWENKNLLHKAEHYHTLWKDALELPSEPSAEYRIRMEDLENENHSLKEEVAALRAQLEEALAANAKLKAQMNRDHENSSIPSSQRPFHKKIKNSREKTDRRPGGQPGHAGHPRPHMEPTQPPIDLGVPKEAQGNADFYPTGKYVTKQFVDLDIRVTVKEYRAEIYRSRTTGRRIHAAFPKEIANEFNYGKNALALGFLLNNYCNVSIDKTIDLISSLSDGKITLSKGLINSLPEQFSQKTEKERQRIYSMLLLAPSMHVDATACRVNGKNSHVFVCGNHDELLYFFREHKGGEGIKGTPVEEYQQILVHDHDMSFYHYGADHQECLAHVLRYLQDAVENEPDLTWHKKMKEFLSGIIHEAKTNDRKFSEDRIREIEKQYHRILNVGQKEYFDQPPRKYYPDGYNLFKRMRKFAANHLLFIHHPEIDYTNNIAERALRKFKRKFKQAVTFRSSESVQYLCDCISIIETQRLQGANIYRSVCSAFG